MPDLSLFEPPHPAGALLQDAPRLMSGMWADALLLIREGRASAADIDLAMQLGAGYPRGPLAELERLPAAARAGFGPLPAAVAATTQGQASEGFAGPIGVVGSGTMAAGIVEALVLAGRQTAVCSRSQEGSQRLFDCVAGRLARRVAKGTLDAHQSERALALIDSTRRYTDLAPCALIIEAVKEDLAVKRQVLLGLHAVLPPSAVLATNTSSFRVSDVSDVVPGRRVMALHFFNPAGTMKLVELTFPAQADAHWRAEVRGFCRSIGKVPVECADTRGFLVNRLLIPFLNDAVRAHEQGLAIAEIERWMTELHGHPMGPFALIDMIGLDVMSSALQAMAETEGDPRIRPAALFAELIRAGRLGRKSGRGFHTYEARS